MRLTGLLILLISTNAISQIFPDSSLSDYTKITIHGCWDGGQPIYQTEPQFLDEKWYFKGIGSSFYGYKSISKEGLLGFYNPASQAHFTPVIEEFYINDCSYLFNYPAIKTAQGWGVIMVDNNGIIQYSTEPYYDKLTPMRFVVRSNFEYFIYENIRFRSAIENKFFIAELDGKCGVINYEGSILVPIENKWITLTEKYTIICQNDSCIYATNLNSGEITQNYENILSQSFVNHPNKSGYEYLKCLKNGKESVLDLTLNRIHDESFDQIEGVIGGIYDNEQDKYYIVEKDQLFGLTDSIGEFILPIKYQEIKVIDFNCTTRGEKRVVGYEGVSHWSKTVILIKNNDKWGFANRNGKILISPQYDRINPTYSNPSRTFLQVYTGNDFIELEINGDYTELLGGDR
jgi:hypothetical protein